MREVGGRIFCLRGVIVNISVRGRNGVELLPITQVEHLEGGQEHGFEAGQSSFWTFSSLQKILKGGMIWSSLGQFGVGGDHTCFPIVIPSVIMSGKQIAPLKPCSAQENFPMLNIFEEVGFISSRQFRSKWTFSHSVGLVENLENLTLQVGRIGFQSGVGGRIKRRFQITHQCLLYIEWCATSPLYIK